MWGGGGVASLMKSDAKGALCLGSVVYLTDEELDRLAAFEGGYDLKEVQVELFMRRNRDDDNDNDDYSPISDYEVGDTIAAASTYIRRDHMFIEPPSEAYLTAITVHLKEHFENANIDISYCRGYAEVAHRGRYIAPPGAALLRTLEAFMVAVNSHKQHSPKWVMPKSGLQVAAKLKVSDG